MNSHLRRLDRVWLDPAIYFVTTCTRQRRTTLASAEVAEILIDESQHVRRRHGWSIGRYVIMPDHVHFFCLAGSNAKPLSMLTQSWKQWTSKRMTNDLGLECGLWQAEFFDHVLRSSESYSQKWDYVRENPVRAGLVANAENWPWQGEIEVLMF